MTAAEAPATLDALRGLHMPGGSVGLVPSELVAAAMVGFVAALLVGLLRHLRSRARASVRRAALAELAGSRSLDGPSRLVAQARLLRRLARTLAGDEAATAQGASWAAGLDTLLRTDFFTAGTGRVLTDGLYRRGMPDLDALDAELTRLIGRLKT